MEGFCSRLLSGFRSPSRIRPAGTRVRVVCIALALAACLFGAGPSAAGPLEDGAKAHKRGDYGTAYRFFKPLAEKGDADAQYNLGIMLENGQGLPRDDAGAARWYRMAAERGSADAQYNLGVLYDEGRGVPRDDAEAMKWYRKAAEQGMPEAQHNLGYLRYKGQGVPKDLVAAHMWFDIAAARYPASQAERSKRSRSAMEAVASMMTPAQIGRARKLAAEWKPGTVPPAR